MFALFLAETGTSSGDCSSPVFLIPVTIKGDNFSSASLRYEPIPAGAFYAMDNRAATILRSKTQFLDKLYKQNIQHLKQHDCINNSVKVLRYELLKNGHKTIITRQTAVTTLDTWVS